MIEIYSREIVAQARTWVGTSFCHLGRLKKTGISPGACDYLGLLIGVARELGLKDRFGSAIVDLDEVGYSLIPNGHHVLAKLNHHFIAKDSKNFSVGDLALFSFAGNPQHLGIIGTNCYGGIDKLTIIHAYFSLGKVCEHILDKKWQARIVAVFNLTSNQIT